MKTCAVFGGALALSACATTSAPGVEPALVIEEPVAAEPPVMVEPVVDSAAPGSDADGGRSITVVQSSGEIRALYPTGKKLSPTDRVTLAEGDNLVVLDNRGTRVISGPGEFSVGGATAGRGSALGALASNRPSHRTQSRAAKSASGPPPPPPPPPAIYRISSATASALTRYPRGSKVYKGVKLCLRSSEQMTVSGNDGTSVTYTGPGCLRRPTNGKPRFRPATSLGHLGPSTSQTPHAGFAAP